MFIKFYLITKLEKNVKTLKNINYKNKYNTLCGVNYINGKNSKVKLELIKKSRINFEKKNYSFIG